MKIEFLVVLAVLFVLVVWAVWYRTTNWLIKRRYKPENDKSRYGEEERLRLIAKDKELGAAKQGTDGRESGTNEQRLFFEPEGRQLLPNGSSETIVKDEPVPGTPSNSNGKSRRFFQNPFRRRK